MKLLEYILIGGMFALILALCHNQVETNKILKEHLQDLINQLNEKDQNK